MSKTLLYESNQELQSESSFLKDAVNTSIGAMNVTSAGRDVHIYSGLVGNPGFDTLQKHTSQGAFHDSAERGDPPKCHPGTRTAIIAKILGFLSTQNQNALVGMVVWLYGPAGGGKTAIAQTIAEECDHGPTRHLVASFFFARTVDGRNNEKNFVASLAYQLCLSIPQASHFITSTVQSNPSVFTRTVITQMRELIIKPLNDAFNDGSTLQSLRSIPRLIVVDGLDECHSLTAQSIILDAIAETVAQLQFPLTFLVASRPEFAIRTAFNKTPMNTFIRGIALDDDYRSDDDIIIFLTDTFKEIRTNHPAGPDLPPDWPLVTDIKYLVQQSSGQFIYAATAAKYIQSYQHNPIRRLKIVLGLTSPGIDTPFTQLDNLYRHILSSVDDSTKVMEVLSLIILQNGYDVLLTVKFTDDLLGYEEGDTRTALSDMHALVRVPKSNRSKSPLRIYHASLYDFLLDKSRSGDIFFIDAKIAHTELSKHFVRILKATEQQNILPLSTNYIIGGLVHHCAESGLSDTVLYSLKTFSLQDALRRVSFKSVAFCRWNAFFDCLKAQSAQSTSDTRLFSRLQREFDSWIRSALDQYPIEIGHHILAILETSVIPETWAPILFDILLYDMDVSNAEMVRVKELDSELFDFQKWDTIHFNDTAKENVLYIFSHDAKRAGPYYVDGGKSAKLTKKIIKCLCCESEHARKGVFPFDRPHFSVASYLLEVSDRDDDLLMTLCSHALQYTEGDPRAESREGLAADCRRYLEKHGVPYLTHSHEDIDAMFPTICTICKYLTPEEQLKYVRQGGQHQKMSDSWSQSIGQKLFKHPWKRLMHKLKSK